MSHVEILKLIRVVYKSMRIYHLIDKLFLITPLFDNLDMFKIKTYRVTK